MDTQAFLLRLRQLPHAFWAILATSLTTFTGYLLHPWVDQANTVMLYLLNVVVLATLVNRFAVFLSVVLSVGMFDFFFVPPHFSFAVADAQYLITFLVMMITGGLIAGLTANLKAQVALNADGAQQSKQLYVLAEALAGVTNVVDACQEVRRFNDQIGLVVKFYLPLNAVSDISDQVDISILNATMQHGSVVETGGLHSVSGTAMLLPIGTREESVGVLVVMAEKQHGSWPLVHRALLQTVTSLLATTLARLQLEVSESASRVAVHSERLRSSLLSALSHDLRTPLTALVGIADTLAMHKEKTAEDKEALILSMQQQSRAIGHMVTNLLDMAKLQAGAVTLHKEWQFLDEVVYSAAQLLGGALAPNRLTIEMQDDMPLVEFDAVMIERVVGNLLENAVKYAHPDASIAVQIGADEARVWLSVKDIGPGFPADKLNSLFLLFERGHAESVTPGIGLGLAIASAIMAAHGGDIQAANHLDSNQEVAGAVVTITLPKGNAPQLLLEEVD